MAAYGNKKKTDNKFLQVVKKRPKKNCYLHELSKFQVNNKKNEL